jgi:predicted Rossmann fold flavoprotein
MKRVVIIGGGAAGFFSAINIKTRNPELDVLIVEKTSKVLQKVKVSGGGRCNVTNGRKEAGELVTFYPRGGKKLYPVFKAFGTEEMRNWLSIRGVSTKEEVDGRVFPESDDSQTIIDCFLNECKSLGISITYQTEVHSFFNSDDHWKVQTNEGILHADYLVMTAGASGKCWKMLDAMGFEMNEQVPSLFTFHINDDRIAGLPGLSFPDVQVKVAGTKLMEFGPLLITHWGLSGPAILKLSAWGAVELATRHYQFNLIVNFCGLSFDACRQQLEHKKSTSPKRLIKNEGIEGIPKRYWERLVAINSLEERAYGDLGKSQINKLCEEMTQANFEVRGKSAFKEEFVTCGGVRLTELNMESMECKRFPGLFMAGEIIDVDALTGGFNFQACWSAGWLISERINKLQNQ